MEIFFFFLLLSTFPSSIFSLCLENFTKLQLPPGVTSTSSTAFKPLGTSPFTGAKDGQIHRYDDILHKAFVPYGFTSPNRNNSYCDGQSDPNKVPICGRPLGTGFSPLGDKLYVIDQYYGLGAIELLGGQAKLLLPTNNGVPYNLLVNLDVDKDGIVRFTDASSIATPEKYGPSNPIPSTDSTGKLYEYNPFTKKVKPLVENLSGPLGIATDADATFLLISETAANRISKYHLKGEKAGTFEVILNITGRAVRINRNTEGNYWFIMYTFPTDGTALSQAVKIDSCGKILATVDLSNEYKVPLSTAKENGEKLYIGGPELTYVGVYDIVS